MNKLIKYSLFLFTMAMLMSVIMSCNCSDKEQRDIVTEWIGKELIIPDSLQFQIGDIPIEYDFNDADYKIVTYIDSTGCTGCKMRLKEWDNFISSLKCSSDTVRVNFVMIVSHVNTEYLNEILKQKNFLHPITIDNEGIFYKSNHLPENNKYQTFLLTGDNRIVAIGNPINNPKIKDVYENIILGSQHEAAIETYDINIASPNPIHVMGVVSPGDRVFVNYQLINKSSQNITVQDIVTSCHCVAAISDISTVLPDGMINIDVTYKADSVSQQIYKYVDVYFKERQNPVRLHLCGFIKKH